MYHVQHLYTLQALDRERLSLAEERRALSDARIASSRAAEEARAAQLKLADAVRAYVQQGVPIPFALDGEHLILGLSVHLHACGVMPRDIK